MLERFNRLMNIIQYLPWIEIFIDLWRVGNKAIRGLSVEGMYEVLEYESTLELKDGKGKKAYFHKREKVRFLQDNIIAYQDQAWGDGKILQNYRRCWKWCGNLYMEKAFIYRIHGAKPWICYEKHYIK